MKTSAKSIFLLFMTAIIWGFAFAAQALTVGVIETYAFNGIRFILGGVSLVPVILLFERDRPDKAKIKRTLFSGMLAGVILFSASTLQQYGIVFTESPGKAGFITGLYTVLVPVIGFMFFKRKTTLYTWIGVICAVCGLYLLSFGGNVGFSSVGIGDLLLLVGAVFWALHIIVIDRFVRDVSPLKFSLVQFITTGAISLVCSAFLEHTTWTAVIGAGIPILYCGILSVGVAYTCQALGQKGAEPAFASIILSTETVFAALGGAIFCGEQMSAQGYIGCAVIFVGILLSQIQPKKIPA